MVATKMIGRIPCNEHYSYVEITGKETDEQVQALIDKVNKFSVPPKNSGFPEVVLKEKKCSKCGGRLLEQIGISEKNNKPYHRIKCENKNCDYIQWVEVESK